MLLIGTRIHGFYVGQLNNDQGIFCYVLAMASGSYFSGNVFFYAACTDSYRVPHTS